MPSLPFAIPDPGNDHVYVNYDDGKHDDTIRCARTVMEAKEDDTEEREVLTEDG